MKCLECKKKIEKGYKLGCDIFCSKKCLWNHVKDATEFSFEKGTKEEIYKDVAALEVQQDVLNEDMDYEQKTEVCP